MLTIKPIEILVQQSIMQGWYGLAPMIGGSYTRTFALGTGLLDPWTMRANTLIPADAPLSDTFPIWPSATAQQFWQARPRAIRRMLRADWSRIPALRHVMATDERLHHPCAAHMPRALTPISRSNGRGRNLDLRVGQPGPTLPELQGSHSPAVI